MASPPPGQLRVGRYFAALLIILLALYAAVFLTGDKQLKPRLGLDLSGGTQVTLKARSPNGKAPTADQLKQAKQILEQRVNGLGVAESTVVTQGSDQIVISAPGKSGEAIKQISQTAKLAFRQVVSESDGTGKAPQAPQAPPGAPGAPGTAPGGTAPGGTAPGGTAPGGTAPGGTAPGGTAPGGTAPGGTVPQGRALGQALLAATPSPTATASGKASPTPRPTASSKASPKTSGKASASPSSKTSGKASPSPSGKASGTPSPAPTSVAQLSAQQKAKIAAILKTLPATQLAQNPQITCEVLKLRPSGSTDDPTKQQVGCDKTGTQKYLLDKASVVGTDIKSADYGQAQNSAGWEVNLSFKGSGQSKWTALTKKAFGATPPTNQVAIVLDGQVVSAPAIQGVITGQAQITGAFTRTDAENLANVLKYGALPLSFGRSEAFTVSPTLGSDQLTSGMLAGGIGLALVVVYSLIYYRALGLITIASLLLSGAIVLASVVLLGRQIGFTLSLAGIAGFIVAVGITADSFVVFFERLKDEVKSGRSVRSSVPRAWVRARRTIISADTVSFLAAAVLYFLSVGEVKGFAFTLGLSTIIDVLIVFIFTHPLVSLCSRSRAFESARFTGLGNVLHHEPTALASPRRLPRPATAAKES